MSTTMQAFALPPRLTTRYSAETWAARMKELRQKELVWQTDPKKRPPRVPAKAVCWAAMPIQDAGQHHCYLYVVPSKKGGYLLRSKYRHDPLTYPLRVSYAAPDDVSEPVPFPEHRAKTVQAAKSFAQSVQDGLRAERTARRKDPKILKVQRVKKTREQILAEEAPPPPSRRDQYVKDGEGLWDVLGIDPDTIPKSDAEFEDWFNRRACGSPSRAAARVDKATGEAAPAGKDRFGMRLGTRAARINAVLSEKPKSAKKIKEESGEASVAAHLGKLVGQGHLEVKLGKKTGAKLYFVPAKANAPATPARKKK